MQTSNCGWGLNSEGLRCYTTLTQPIGLLAGTIIVLGPMHTSCWTVASCNAIPAGGCWPSFQSCNGASNIVLAHSKALDVVQSPSAGLSSIASIT